MSFKQNRVHEENLMSKWDQENRVAPRMSAMEPIEGRPPSKLAMCFPGKDALCVKLASTLGTFDKDTRLIAVESVPSVQPRMKKSLAEIGFTEGKNLHVIGCDLAGYDLGALQDSLGDFQIDTAFFDLCGDLTLSLLWWLVSYRGFFADDLRFSVTTKAVSRQPRVLAASIEAAGFGSMPLFDHRLLRRFESRHNNVFDKDPNPGVVKSKVWDILRLNTQLLQSVFSDRILQPRTSYVYRSAGTARPGVEGRTLISSVSTLSGRKNPRKSVFEAWLMRVLSIAGKYSLEDYTRIIRGYYGIRPLKAPAYVPRDKPVVTGQ